MGIELVKEKKNITLETEQDNLAFKQALKGEKGDSGFSPIVEVIEAEEGHNVVITDNEGVKTFFVKDGESGTTLTSGDNTVVEDNAINVYTNTGYIISDKDIKYQPILNNNTSGTNHIVYTDNEVMIIYNGTTKIKRSVNGIDFEDIRLPYSCKSMFYNPISKRIYGLCINSYFIYSEDDGLTWQLKQHNIAGGADYVCRTQAHITGFGLINKASKKLYGLTENFV